MPGTVKPTKTIRRKEKGAFLLSVLGMRVAKMFMYFPRAILHNYIILAADTVDLTKDADLAKLAPTRFWRGAGRCNKDFAKFRNVGESRKTFVNIRCGTMTFSASGNFEGIHYRDMAQFGSNYRNYPRDGTGANKVGDPELPDLLEQRDDIRPSCTEVSQEKRIGGADISLSVNSPY